MGNGGRKYICIRVSGDVKQIFYEKRDEIKRELDRILEGEKELKIIESQDMYDERVFFDVDTLYYKKIQELAKKYKKPVSAVIRSAFYSLS